MLSSATQGSGPRCEAYHLAWAWAVVTVASVAAKNAALIISSSVKTRVAPKASNDAPLLLDGAAGYLADAVGSHGHADAHRVEGEIVQRRFAGDDGAGELQQVALVLLEHPSGAQARRGAQLAGNARAGCRGCLGCLLGL